MDTCPSCGHFAAGYGGETDAPAVRCRACGEFLDPAQKMRAAASRDPAALPAWLVKDPRRWSASVLGRVLTVRYRWSRVRGLLSLAWAGVIAWCALKVVAHVHPEEFIDSEIALLLGVMAVVLVVARFAYRGLGYCVNSTELVLGPRGFEAHHGPLPWPGSVAVPIEEVLDFASNDEPRKNLTDHFWHAVGGTRKDGRRVASPVEISGRKWDLVIRCPDGISRKLVRNLRDAEGPHWAQGRLDHHLKVLRGEIGEPERRKG